MKYRILKISAVVVIAVGAALAIRPAQDRDAANVSTSATTRLVMPTVSKSSERESVSTATVTSSPRTGAEDLRELKLRAEITETSRTIADGHIKDELNRADLGDARREDDFALLHRAVALRKALMELQLSRLETKYGIGAAKSARGAQ